MAFNFKLRKISFLILLNFIFSNCNYNTEETVNKTTKTLRNDKHITVEKTNKETTSQGVFTNHNYGTTHSFSYKLLIRQDAINWDGGSGEPKNILFCKDTTYIRYLKKERIKTKYIDTTDNILKYNYRLEIRESYQKHLDNRYFFNLLGDDFWINITPKIYNSLKKNCDEYPIPNDNELSLKQTVFSN